MGSTFSAIHLRGARAADVAAALEERVTASGEYERADDTGEPSPTDRLVVVVEDGNGWCVIADGDHELDPEGAAETARALSKTHRTEALLIAVHHSDTALLARFSKGRARGQLCVPEDARLDEKTGHRHVDASFVKDLAVGPARQQLSAPLQADRTFPESTILEVARLVGLGDPAAGARSLWAAPLEGAIRLRFTLSAPEPVGVTEWRPPGEEDARMVLRHQPAVETCVGAPCADVLHFQLQSYEPGRVEGLVVELSGDAVPLLGATRASGWNAVIQRADGASTLPAEVTLTTDAGVQRATFPSGFVEAAPQPTMAGFSPVAFRQWSEALGAHHQKQFHFRLEGTVARAGTGTLQVRVSRLDGSPLPVMGGAISVRVRPAPREPVLPADAVTNDPSRSRTLEEYAANDFVAGWLAFDATWQQLGGLLLDLGSRVARLVATPEALELTLTSAGTHPTVKARFGPDAHLTQTPFAVAVRTLEQEAQVRLHQPYQRMVERAEPQGELLIAHEPRGTTIFDEKTRAHFEAMRPQPRLPPLTLAFCLPAPVVAANLSALEAVFDEAVAAPSCAGALLTPSPRWHLDGLPWERLAGTERFSSDVEYAKHHARAPGWLVLAAGDSARRVEPSSALTVRRVASGALLRSAAASPTSMAPADREVMERAVLPALGSLTELCERFSLPR